MKFEKIPSRNRSLITKGIRDSFKRTDKYKDCLKKARVEIIKYNKDGNKSKRPSVFYRCADCGELYKQVEVQVDHIKPVVGTNELTEWLDLNEYARRVYELAIQVLCKPCHKDKSKEENRLRRAFKKSLKK